MAWNDNANTDPWGNRDIPWYKFYLDIGRNIFLWIVIAVGINASMSYLGLDSKKEYVKKETIHNNFMSAIQNGADVRAIKQLYINRKVEEKPFILFSSFDENNYYSSESPLSTVLEDIRASLYLNDNKDISLIPKIDQILINYSQTNPFDHLKNGQKDQFDNIRIKLGDDYIKIQNNINRIVEELSQKNKLVDLYLSDSRASLFVSIFSVIFALVIAAYQIYQSRPDKVRKIYKEGIDHALYKMREEQKAPPSGESKA